MTLDFLHNVFLLHFALEATQCTFQSFAVLQMYFCQLNSPPSGQDCLKQTVGGSQRDTTVYCSVLPNVGSALALARAYAFDDRTARSVLDQMYRIRTRSALRQRMPVVECQPVAPRPVNSSLADM